MAIKDIKVIHEKEAEIKRLYDKKLEEKRQEFLNLDNYYSEKLKEAKSKLNNFQNEYELKKKTEVEKKVDEINKDTEKYLKEYSNIDNSKIEEAKKFIKENLFK